MRSNSIHDKAGNNYRYLRAQKRLQEQEEKQLSDRKWSMIYDKIIKDPNKKTNVWEKKTYGSK